MNPLRHNFSSNSDHFNRVAEVASRPHFAARLSLATLDSEIRPTRNEAEGGRRLSRWKRPRRPPIPTSSGVHGTRTASIFSASV